MRLTVFLFLLVTYNLFSQDTVKVALNLGPEQQAEQRYNEGLEAIKKNQLEQAVFLFSQCLLVKPEFDKAYANRAIAYSQTKFYNEALNDINKAIALNPQNPDYFYNKSLIFGGLHNKDSQLVVLDVCLKMAPEHAEANYYKGLFAYEEGNYDKAISYYSIAIQSKRNYAFAYNDRASAKRTKGDLEGAIIDYEKAITVDSSFVFIYNNLGSAYRVNKSYDKAIQYYTLALKKDPGYMLALMNRGVCHFETNDLKAAQKDFEDLLSQSPKNAEAYNNLCSIALKLKDYEKAIMLASRSIELNANNGAAYYNRGIAKQLIRDEEGSCSDWNKALELGVLGAKTFINASCSN